MIMFVSVMKYSYDNVQCSMKLNGNLIDLLKQGCALSMLDLGMRLIIICFRYFVQPNPVFSY
jgi:hypothetical protein